MGAPLIPWWCRQRACPLVIALLFASAAGALAQTATSPLADLRWSTAETGLEVWTYPLQLVRHYRIGFRLEGDTADVDGRVALRTIAQTPTNRSRYRSRRIVRRECRWRARTRVASLAPVNRTVAARRDRC